MKYLEEVREALQNSLDNGYGFELLSDETLAYMIISGTDIGGDLEPEEILEEVKAAVIEARKSF